jgi:hypothetical protein
MAPESRAGIELLFPTEPQVRARGAVRWKRDVGSLYPVLRFRKPNVLSLNSATFS